MGGVTAVGLASLVLGGPAGAVSPSLIQGSGSSWAEKAVNQWVADVNSQGIQVVYNPDGDAAGRQDFANRVSDFAVTSDGYQGSHRRTAPQTPRGRPYAYLPIAAGGTSFAYQIKVDGTQVKNLRLSGQTLAKIFTGQITSWSNPTITNDNNGGAAHNADRPGRPVRGSGATHQLTNYFSREYPEHLEAYAGQAGPTEYFPVQGKADRPNGSSGAINYVASSAGNGAIGYVEYSYALERQLPGGQGPEQRPATTPCRPSTTWPCPWRQATDHNKPAVVELSAPDTRQRVHRHRFPHVPAVVVRLHDRAHRDVSEPGEQDHNRQTAGDGRLPVLRHLPGQTADRRDRLLPAAGQPGRGRVRPDQ